MRKFDVRRSLTRLGIGALLAGALVTPAAATPANAASAHYLGRVSMDNYCLTRGWGYANRPDARNAYSWSCSRTGSRINVNQACAEQYYYRGQRTWAYGWPSNRYNAYSWGCYRWY